MAKLALGDNIPQITVTTTTQPAYSLGQLQGKNVVLYFYPKDNTPGCTMESKAFRDNYKKFQSLQTEILGVSRDSVASHTKFSCKHVFPFELISDADGKLCELFDVIKSKKLFGVSFEGIQRSTFVFDKKGKLRHIFRGVKVKNHVEEILACVRELRE